MTGFSHKEFMVDATKLFLTIKSVNSKFLDININLPINLQHMEVSMNKVIRDKLARGKIDIYMGVDRSTLSSRLELNNSLLEEYLKLIKKINMKTGSGYEARPSDIINFEGIVSNKQNGLNIKFEKNIKTVFLSCLNQLKKMRQVEGKSIHENFIEILSRMDSSLKRIKKRLPLIIQNYKKKLRSKIEELVGKKLYDEGRVLIEVALLADKMDINEELERLKGHFMEMKKYIKGNGPCGKLMEFLLQEMLRESNTMGSKISDIEITKNVIILKESIEQMREQSRNVE